MTRTGACKSIPEKSWGVADAGNGNCTGLLFFDSALQKGYKAWLRRIYADTNPYTGVPLAKDPAVAVILTQNEDGILFWTTQSIKGQALLNLRKLFGDWLVKKYGALKKAPQAWQGYKHEEDDFASGRPGMFIVWELTQDARNKKGNAPGREARLADQTEFLGRLAYDFHRDVARYLREELGCQQLVNAGNWRSADQVILDDVERWGYTANDVIGKDHYFGGIHNGLNVGWQILPGQVFSSRSFTKDPTGSPLCLRQVAGRPVCYPGEPLGAAHPLRIGRPAGGRGAELSDGTGHVLLVRHGRQEWQTPANKWTFAVPMTLGQFPAAALLFRKGYVAEGPAVVHEERTLADVFHRRPPLIAEEGAWDPNRDKGDVPQGSHGKATVDPLAFLVGRVEVKYGGDPAKSSVAELSKYINPVKKTVRSVTGRSPRTWPAGCTWSMLPRPKGQPGSWAPPARRS